MHYTTPILLVCILCMAKLTSTQSSSLPSDDNITFHLTRTKIQYIKGEDGCNYDVVLALIIVFVELWAIAWIQNKYMETPFWRATLQVVVGGALVLAAGVLIGAG